MTNKHDIVSRWVDVALGLTDRSNLRSERSNIIADGDAIYSYGYHFEMARLVRDRKGQPSFFLLNGDRYSVTTSGHQSLVRGQISRSDMPSVIIPYSALASAGVARDTIQIVEATPDRGQTIKHKTNEHPDGFHWRWEPQHGYVDKSDEYLAGELEHRNATLQRNHDDAVRRHEENPTLWSAPPPLEQITVDDLDKQVWACKGVIPVLRSRNLIAEVTALPDGTCSYEWETYRHWLGESLVRAETEVRGGKNRKSYFLSGFDHNESRALYFFCELPTGVNPTTVAEAYECLKPDVVKTAEANGRSVERQGDIFAIEVTTANKKDLRKAGARFEKHGYLLNTNHTATEVAYMPDGVTLVRGTMTHSPEFRAADHSRVKLGDGKTWHIAIKNTVPIAVQANLQRRAA